MSIFIPFPSIDYFIRTPTLLIIYLFINFNFIIPIFLDLISMPRALLMRNLIVKIFKVIQLTLCFMTEGDLSIH